jgi:hypothetical protein
MQSTFPIQGVLFEYPTTNTILSINTDVLYRVTVDKIKKEFKRTGIIIEGLKQVEKDLHKYLWRAFDNKLNVATLYDYEEKKQIRGKLTVNICDYFMQWILLEGNKFLQSKNSFLVIKKRDYVTISESDEKNENEKSNQDDEEEKMSFDLIIECDGREIKYEIKFSQNNNVFQGSTHGKNKVPNFILIQFYADLNRIISEENKGFLGNIWVGFLSKKPVFNGEPDDKSSRTSFSLSKNDYNIDEMNNLTIFGSNSPRQKRWIYWNLDGDKLYN